MSNAEIFKSVQAKISSNLRVAMPGIIEKYDFKTQKADIKIDMQESYVNDTSIDYPVIANVPVIFPKSGKASLTMPVIRGDSCLVVFTDRDMTNWLLGASKQKPNSKRAHHLSDAVAVMGLSPFTQASKAENNTDVLLTYDGSQVRLKPQGVVDIHSAKEINIKTENVIINCKTASIKAEEFVNVECKNATVKSIESVSIECKNANLKAAESIIAECKNASIKSSENSNIECLNANVKAKENISLECKTASLKSTGDISAECVNANIKATGAINSETPMFTQKGDMKIDGKIEVTGVSLLNGKLTTKAGIENSGANLVSNGKTFETHTHNYQDVAAVITAEGPAKVTKVPTATQQPV